MAKRLRRERCQRTALDAAEIVLRQTARPMRCSEIVEAMLSKGYWTTTGQTPSATLHAAISRDIGAKGKKSRFRRTGKGLFSLAK